VSHPMIWSPDALRVDQVAALGGYQVILADPPWAYDDKLDAGRRLKYDTLAADPIASLPIAEIAAPDAALFLWGTYPKLPEILALMPRWGFTFKTIAFQWIKTRGVYPDGSAKPFLGLGRWTRGNTEPCLLGVRGRPQRISGGVSQLLFSADHEELVVAPLARHSAKPPEVRDRIVALMGADVTRIELFARERTAGWDAWGDEVPSDVMMATG